MSDPWSREYAEAHPSGFGDAVEIELDTEVGRTLRRPDSPTASGSRRGPSRRVVVGGALVLALAVTTVTAVTLSGGSEGDAEPPPTTIDPFLLSAAITTPPTLERDDEPAASSAPASTVPASIVPASTAAATTLPPAALVATDFSPVVGFDPDHLDDYDLTSAVTDNVPGDEPVRTMFRIAGLVGAGDRPTVVSVTAASDPVAQRDSVTITAGETYSRTLIDRAAHLAYRSSPALPADSWARFTDAEVLEGTDASDVGQLFDAVVTGPITPQLLESATITPADGLVRLGGGAIARRYDVTVERAAIAPWGAMMFAASPDASVTSRDGSSTLTFEVYVTNQPALALVVGQFDVDGEARAIMQFFDRRPANVRIELPEPDQVIGADETG